MDILNSIPILNEEDTIKVQVEDISNIHPSLTFDNPLTFEIFLSKRPDLSKEDVEIYKEIIKRLQNNDEKIRYSKCFKEMIDSTEALNFKENI